MIAIVVFLGNKIALDCSIADNEPARLTAAIYSALPIRIAFADDDQRRLADCMVEIDYAVQAPSAS